MNFLQETNNDNKKQFTRNIDKQYQSDQPSKKAIIAVVLFILIIADMITLVFLLYGRIEPENSNDLPYKYDDEEFYSDKSDKKQFFENKYSQVQNTFDIKQYSELR